MEQNDLESFLNEASPEPPEEETPAPQEEEEIPQEPEEGEEEEVEALTEREQALIEQFSGTESPTEEFDPSVPPKGEWAVQEYQFLKEGENIDDLLADPVKFNAKMAQFYNDALQRGAQMALEETFRSLPRTVSTFARQQIETTLMVNNFYEANKDLIPLKPALARIAQKIGTEHPEYSLSTLLTESAKAARAIFKLKEAKSPMKQVKAPSPAFVGQKGGNTNRLTRPSSGRTLEDEVMELIS